MTRRFLILAAVFLAAQFLARADDLAKSSVLENDVEYLRVIHVGTNLPDEIQSAQDALAATNKIAGTVLDLRFADGDDLESAKTAADLFVKEKLPLAILVNGETRGAAVKLAEDLREARAGLVFGGATGGLQPDIPVSESAADERKFLANPYGTISTNEEDSTFATNDYLPFVDHTSEADLVRAKVKDDGEAEDLPHLAVPPRPFIRDPVLARAADLIEGLAIVRHQSRS